jgi:hypothetical protein
VFLPDSCSRCGGVLEFRATDGSVLLLFPQVPGQGIDFFGSDSVIVRHV